MLQATMGGTKYEKTLHQPYPNGSPAPKFGMYLRFPSGSGGYTTGHTDPELMQDVDWLKLKFMHWSPSKPPIAAYMNINLCRKLGINNAASKKQLIARRKEYQMQLGHERHENTP